VLFNTIFHSFSCFIYFSFSPFSSLSLDPTDYRIIRMCLCVGRMTRWVSAVAFIVRPIPRKGFVSVLVPHTRLKLSVVSLHSLVPFFSVHFETAILWGRRYPKPRKGFRIYDYFLSGPLIIPPSAVSKKGPAGEGEHLILYGCLIKSRLLPSPAIALFATLLLVSSWCERLRQSSVQNNKHTDTGNGCPSQTVIDGKGSITYRKTPQEVNTITKRATCLTR
jgi:hypothetical protein